MLEDLDDDFFDLYRIRKNVGYFLASRDLSYFDNDVKNGNIVGD